MTIQSEIFLEETKIWKDSGTHGIQKLEGDEYVSPLFSLDHKILGKLKSPANIHVWLG